MAPHSSQLTAYLDPNNDVNVGDVGREADAVALDGRASGWVLDLELSQRDPVDDGLGRQQADVDLAVGVDIAQLREKYSS